MKTIVITGASDGIGAAAARELTKLSHTVVLVGRNHEKTATIASELGAAFFVADYTNLSEVSILADDLMSSYEQIDVLVHNAGLLAGKERIVTEDGFEVTFQVNHLAPFLLNSLLLPLLSSSKSRVIMTSSRAHLQGKLDFTNLQLESGFAPYKAYANTKLMNVMFAHELAKRHEHAGLTAVSFHPGVVSTGFGLNSDSMTGRFYRSFAHHVMRSPSQGAATLVWLATTDSVVNGAYYSDKFVAKQHPKTFDPQLGSRLWDDSNSLLN